MIRIPIITIAVTFALVLFFPLSSVFAQDSALDDALRWFPPGVYEGFIQVDRTFRPDDELSGTLLRLLRAQLKETLLTRVPFLRNYDSATLGLAAAVDLGSSERGHTGKRKKEFQGLIFFWHEMLVLRGADFASVIREAEKAGKLELVSAKKKSPKIYSYRARAGTDRAGSGARARGASAGVRRATAPCHHASGGDPRPNTRGSRSHRARRERARP